MRQRFVCLFAIVCGYAGSAPAQVLDFRGEAALAATVNNVAPTSTYFSARYVPELFLETSLGSVASFDALASVDATATARVISADSASSDGEVEPYRLWARYGTRRFEARVGLQKIAFGSATLLRPLMWFDRLDPRDPLQITEGVYALLLRYYFLNNANIWLWGLLGNDETKGWERLPSTRDDPEFGGRIQVPTGPGEFAVSYHHRRADGSAFLPPGVPGLDPVIPEDRFAIDGKWDATVGLWVEAALVHQRTDLRDRPYARLAVIGVDYTFDVGDGLTVLGEHFVSDTATEPFGTGEGSGVSAGSVRFCWGVVDEFGAIVNYDWQADDLYNYASWRRTYDHWGFNLIVFANPDEGRVTPGARADNLLAGTGAQLLVTYNH